MTLAEFGSWALAQGSVANPPPNNKYKGQCVSLIQQYLYRVFGKSFVAYGNAKDWAYNYPRSYFKSVGVNARLQPGDVLVYGRNYGRGYGHIALIDVNGKFFDQNGIKSLKVAYQNTAWKGYVAVLRPINQAALGLNSSNNTTNNTGRNTVGQTRKLKANVKIWSRPDLSGTYYNYLKNTTVKILENVNNDVDKIYVPATGRTAYINIYWYK